MSEKDFCENFFCVGNKRDLVVVFIYILVYGYFLNWIECFFFFKFEEVGEIFLFWGVVYYVGLDVLSFSEFWGSISCF